MAFTADGIYYQTQTDAFDVAGDSEKTAKSIPGVIVPVANASERDSYTASRVAEGRPPSVSDTLFVRRADTGGIEENAGDGWYSINPVTYVSGAPLVSGALTASALVLSLPIPAAPFARLVSATATLYGANISGGLWDGALSDLISVWTDSQYFARFPPTQGTVVVQGTYLLSAGQSTTLRGWIGNRLGTGSLNASASPEYTRLMATVFRTG